MRAGAVAAIIAASVLASGAGWAACPSETAKRSQHCVNLDLVPQISRQLVADEHIAAPPKQAPAAKPEAGYTGPTIGLNHMVRRAPEVGYRWSIN